MKHNYLIVIGITLLIASVVALLTSIFIETRKIRMTVTETRLILSDWELDE